MVTTENYGGIFKKRASDEYEIHVPDIDQEYVTDLDRGEFRLTATIPLD